MRNSQAAESSHRAQVSHRPAQNRRRETHKLPNQAIGLKLVRHPAQDRRRETHTLPNQAIGLKLVATQRRIVDEKLTCCAIKPPGSSQSSPSAGSSVRNSRAADSGHRAQVSHRRAHNRRWETHSLPNQATGLKLVTAQRRIVDEKLTGCRIKSSDSS